MVFGIIKMLGGTFHIPYWVVILFITICFSPVIFVCFIAFNFILNAKNSKKTSILEIIIPVLVLVNIILYSFNFDYLHFSLSLVFYLPIMFLLSIIKIYFDFNKKTNAVIILSYILFCIIYNYYAIFLGTDPLSYTLFS